VGTATALTNPGRQE